MSMKTSSCVETGYFESHLSISISRREARGLCYHFRGPGLALMMALGIILPSAFAADSGHSDSAKEKERQLIALLKSSAPPQDKAIPCKQLAIYGSKNAVPALAALL